MFVGQLGNLSLDSDTVTQCHIWQLPCQEVLLFTETEESAEAQERCGPLFEGSLPFVEMEGFTTVQFNKVWIMILFLGC